MSNHVIPWDTPKLSGLKAPLLPMTSYARVSWSGSAEGVPVLYPVYCHSPLTVGRPSTHSKARVGTIRIETENNAFHSPHSRSHRDHCVFHQRPTIYPYLAPSTLFILHPSSETRGRPLDAEQIGYSRTAPTGECRTTAAIETMMRSDWNVTLVSFGFIGSIRPGAAERTSSVTHRPLFLPA